MTIYFFCFGERPVTKSDFCYKFAYRLMLPGQEGMKVSSNPARRYIKMQLNYQLPLLFVLWLSGCSSLWPVAEEPPAWALNQVKVVPLSERVINFLPASEISDSESLDYTTYITPYSVRQIAPLRGGLSAIVGLEDGGIYLFDLISGSQVSFEKIVSTSDSFSSFKLSPDESKLVVSLFSELVVIDLESLAVESITGKVRGRVSSLVWSPDQTVIVGGLADGRLFSWSYESTNRVDWYIGATSSIDDVLFHPSGGAVFASEKSGSVWLWRLTNAEIALGLRDPDSALDRERAATYRRELPVGTDSVKKLLVNEEVSHLFGLKRGGDFVAWKLRGLVPQKLDETLLEPLLVTSEEDGLLVGFTKSQKFVLFSLNQFLNFNSKSVGYSDRLGLDLRKLSYVLYGDILWAGGGDNRLLVSRNFTENLLR